MMNPSLHDRLLKRELGGRRRYSHVRGLYGSRNWAESLDIVNELDGHSGCVNALSWSRSGSLLASGSDDTHVHIHSYLPRGSTSQFDLTTSIATGHTQNIFSVKFMPHSNDRTIISVAGDATVRVFDVEYSATNSRALDNTPSQPRGGRPSVWTNTRYLGYADAKAKVFRSHSERVKRIVTESSPFFFLTCSEDGEVRQWDLREPESTYPTNVSGSFRFGPPSTGGGNCPPPLISYRRYNIDLNTISCSPSRPYYIALGGSHLHCFIHDRRMLGRDHAAERGAALGTPSSLRDDELMSEATQCVRRFAPRGQPSMSRTSTGHITACKISDANPNELIVSWSGDHIYSFDIVQSPDVRDKPTDGRASPFSSSTAKGKGKESIDRKRKRTKDGSSLSLEAAARAEGRARSSFASLQQDEEDLALRVNYGNGQREDIPIEQLHTRSTEPEEPPIDMSASERQSFEIARGTVRLRKALFRPAADVTIEESSSNLTRYRKSFSIALHLASALLGDTEGIIRSWRYTVNPQAADLQFQRQSRRDREKTVRFVQAAGTLSRVLGGRFRASESTKGRAAGPESFLHIRPALNEQTPLERKEHFGYDFLKAICLWLDSGPGALARGFSRRTASARFPLVPPEDEDEPGIDAIDEQLIPYLLHLASDAPILNIDASPFEVDTSRIAFATEKAAVLAFAQAIKLPFEDLTTGAILLASPSASQRAAAQDRSAALRFWGFKIGRGILVNAAEGVDFRCVDRCFGGLGQSNREIRADERRLALMSEKIDTGGNESNSSSVERRAHSVQLVDADEDDIEEDSPDAEDRDDSVSSRSEPEVVIPMDILHSLITDDLEETGEDNGTEDDNDREEESAESADETDLSAEEDLEVDDDDDDAEDDDESDDENESTHALYRAYRNTTHRSKANLHVPVSSHTRSYKGHCNVRTVKDVNFWGLEDEYVVSGSDSGHLFIWDRKTTKLINILEGDGEVVNVVQGHPYEPLLAVSGIDNTIKVFSPDARARRDARLGIGVKKADESEFSSIMGFGSRRRRPRARRSNPLGAAESNLPTTVNEAETQAAVERRSWGGAGSDGDSEEEDGHEGGPPVAEGGLQSRKRMWDEYRILSSNDSVRHGNRRGDFISVSDALSFFLGLA